MKARVEGKTIAKVIVVPGACVESGGEVVSAKPIRGTQTLVDQMSWVWGRPSLVAIEIGWRWLFGVPLLVVIARELGKIFKTLPPREYGLTTLDGKDPWLIAARIGEAWKVYAAAFDGCGEVAGASSDCGLGGALWAWAELDSASDGAGEKWRPVSLIGLQAAQLAVLALVMWGWLAEMGSIAEAHIYIEGEPDLVGYLISAVVLSLTTFVIWALVSWTVMVAPLLVVLEGISPWAALGRSVRLGKAFTSKLAEINLVMGIVRLALLVLAAVFSAAPLPFSDQLGSGSLQMILMASIIFNFVANDYFQVVRLKSFLEFWHKFCGE